jgi:hypothetical protein
MGLIIASMSLVAQASDPHMGTWKLNLAKSKYSPDPKYKSQTLKWEPAADGAFRFTSDIVSAQGETIHIETLAKLDGKNYPMKGAPAGTAWSWKRINDRAWEVVRTANGTVTITHRDLISADGKTLTRTDKGKNAQGEVINSLVVFDKQ